VLASKETLRGPAFRCLVSERGDCANRSDRRVPAVLVGSLGDGFDFFTAELSFASDLRFVADFGVFGADEVDAFGLFVCDFGVCFLADFLALLLLDFTRGVTVRESVFRVGVRLRERDRDLGLDFSAPII
jgi:hypothetical protein